MKPISRTRRPVRVAEVVPDVYTLLAEYARKATGRTTRTDHETATAAAKEKP